MKVGKFEWLTLSRNTIIYIYIFIFKWRVEVDSNAGGEIVRKRFWISRCRGRERNPTEFITSYHEEVFCSELNYYIAACLGFLAPRISHFGDTATRAVRHWYSTFCICPFESNKARICPFIGMFYQQQRLSNRI